MGAEQIISVRRKDARRLVRDMLADCSNEVLADILYLLVGRQRRENYRVVPSDLENSRAGQDLLQEYSE